MVVASPQALFGLPKIAVGLYAAAGGLPRLMRIAGLQLASEIAMTGRKLTTKKLEYRLINRVSESQSVLGECLKLADQISTFLPMVSLSPDKACARHGKILVLGMPLQESDMKYVNRLIAGENFKIGVEAFAKKSKPHWVPSHL